MERKDVAKRTEMMRHLELKRPVGDVIWWTMIAVPLDDPAREGGAYTYAGKAWQVNRRYKLPWPRMAE